MSERRIEAAIEVPATPEQAWEAIATGPGITAWFMPAEVEGRPGGSIVHHHGAEMPSSGTVTAYDPPRRFAYEEQGWLPEGEHGGAAIATEFLVEARAGGSCVVRVVMSGFGDGEAWDRAIESFEAGWRQALGALRLYLENFRGEPVASIAAGTTTSGGKQAVWSAVTDALGLPREPRAGERLSIGGDGVPALAGTLREVAPAMLTLVLDEPARGIGFIGAGGPDADEVFVFVRAQLFGSGAGPIAEREQAAWQDWFAGRSLAAAS